MPDKQIKFELGVDTASAQKVKRVISEITAEVQRLVAATHQVQLGGGAFGLKVGGITGTKGVGPGQLGTRLQQAGGGITDGLARAVQNSAALFKNAAQGSKDSFRIMSDGLKRHVDDSSREIGRLETSLARLERQYDRLKTRQASGLGGKLTSNAMEQAQGEYYSTLGQLDKARANRKTLIKTQEGFDTEADARGFNGPFGRVRGYFNKTGDAAGQVVQKVGAQFGIPPGVMTGVVGPAAAAAAGAAVGWKMAQSGRGTEMANLDYNIDRPFFRMNARATAGSVYGGNALAIHHGDIARVVAISRLAQDKDYRDLVGPDMQKALRVRRALATPNDIVGMVAAGSNPLAGLKDYAIGKAGAKIADLITGEKNSDVSTLARARMTHEQQTLLIERQQKALDLKLQEDPEFVDRVNRFYGGALGDTGLARAAHLSGGNRNIKVNNPLIAGLLGVKHGVLAPFDTVRLFQAQSLAAGYSDSERIGARHELAGAAGMGFFGYGDSILGAKAGGLHNVAQILGAGSQFGGGSWSAAKRFLGRGGTGGFGIQSMIGRGGVDITAGANIASLGMGLMNAGQFMGSGAPGSGLGIMRTLMEATSTGTIGGDMRMANIVQSGVGALGNMMSGGIDPLQKAMNASAALQAAPGGTVMLKDALMRMDPAQMMEFMRTKHVPPELASVGVTPQIMEKYIAAQNRTAFARVTSSMTGGGSSATGAAMERYRKAGGLGYLKGSSRKAVEAEMRDLAPGAVFAGLAKDNMSGLGYMRTLAASQGLLGSLKGRGAGDSVSKTSARAASLGAQSVEKLVEGGKVGAESGEITTAANATPFVAKAQDDLRKNALTAFSGNDPDNAIRKIAADLQQFVSAIQAMVNGSHLDTKPGPKTTSLSNHR
jgi:hypothetical protein